MPRPIKFPTPTESPAPRGPGRPRRRTYDEIVAAGELDQARLARRLKQERERAREQREASRLHKRADTNRR